jgi:hypothetical protein
MLVSSWSGSLLAWEEELASFKSRLAAAFGRAELAALGELVHRRLVVGGSA